MGFIDFLSHLLFVSQAPLLPSIVTSESFTLQSWLQNSALDRQFVGWYPSTKNSGIFGIIPHSPSNPLPTNQRAVFVRRSDAPESLFFETGSNIVFVRRTGEIEYATSVPEDAFGAPYTGNFSIVDFTYWPDKSTVEALEFEPEGFDLGTFLACPRTIDGERGYQLLAMTPMFRGGGGCVTLEWLVRQKVENEDSVREKPLEAEVGGSQEI